MKTTKGATYITSYKVFLKAQKQNVAEVTLQNNYVKSLTLFVHFWRIIQSLKYKQKD